MIEATFKVERQTADAVRAEASAIRDECQNDLEAVMPAFQRALRALEALEKRDIQEIKSFTSPPALVETVMNAVCLLLGRKQSWEEAKKVLCDTSLLQTLREYDKEHISAKLLQQLTKYTGLDDFSPEKVSTVSKAATSLCMWVLAIENFAKASPPPLFLSLSFSLFLSLSLFFFLFLSTPTQAPRSTCPYAD